MLVKDVLVPAWFSLSGLVEFFWGTVNQAETYAVGR